MGAGAINQYLLFLLIDLLFFICCVIYLSSSFIVAWKAKAPEHRYKGENLFFFGQITSKLNTTSKTMTLICVTLVLAIFMFIAAPILVGWASGYLDIRSMYDVQISSRYNDVYDEENLPDDNYELVTDFLSEHGIETDYDCTFSLYLPSKDDFHNRMKYDFPVVAISLSDYNTIRKMLGYEPITLSEDEFTTQWQSIATNEERDTLYRVSTKGQVEKDDIPMQKEACRNFAESQGWEIVKEFSEKGVSGFKKSAKERDELQKIQQAAMEGKFDILLVFMFDRLGRRDDETPFIVEWFTKQGIEVWSVNEGQQRFDTHVDKLMNYIRYWQASGESLKTSVRTRTRLEQLTGEGHYTGGTVAFGYKRVRLGRVNKKNQEVCDLVIDEAEAEIVRLIFHKYVYEGYGAQKLSHYLYEQGVVGRNNKNIPNTSIVRMIKNKGYTGYLINGAVETECPQLRIIEPELFEQAQELRQARTCERGGTSLGTSSKALLTGLVYCAHCGNRLSLTSSGRTHTYADGHTVKEVRPRYSCFYKIRHPGECDGQSGYGVSKLDSIVEEVVRQIFAQFREVSRKKLLESVKTNDAARIQKKVKKIQKDLESKQKELDDLKAETILVIRGVSALDKELLGTLVAEAKDALETLEKQLVQAQEEYEEATKTAKRSNYICNELFTWADVYDTANHDERRAILQQFIKEIRVRKDYEISITLNASFDQVEQLKAVSIYDGAEIFEEISEKEA